MTYISLQTMKNALMQKEKCNVFIVDWSGGDGLLYGTAAANTWIVGAELGRLVERLGVCGDFTKYQ